METTTALRTACPVCHASTLDGLLVHRRGCCLVTNRRAARDADRQWLAEHPDSVARIRPLNRAEQVELTAIGATFHPEDEWAALILAAEQDWDTWTLACRNGQVYAILHAADDT